MTVSQNHVLKIRIFLLKLKYKHDKISPIHVSIASEAWRRDALVVEEARAVAQRVRGRRQHRRELGELLRGEERAAP